MIKLSIVSVLLLACVASSAQEQVIDPSQGLQLISISVPIADYWAAVNLIAWQTARIAQLEAQGCQ